MEHTRRVLVTGATGKLGRPLVAALAAEHDVWAVARFRDRAIEAELTAAGVTCVRGDLAGDLSALPDDPDAFDSIWNLAVAKSGDWGADLDANLGGVIALLHRYPNLGSFVHISSCEVYDPDADRPYREDSPRGNARHNTDVAAMRTYSVAKIAAESAVTATAMALGVPAVIVRLSAPYGDTWGWPVAHLAKIRAGEAISVHPDRPNTFSLLHVDDIIAMMPSLSRAAAVPAQVVNLAGSEAVSIEEWVGELGRLVGVDPILHDSPHALRSIPVDVTRMQALIGTGSIDWRTGMGRIASAAGADGAATGSPPLPSGT
ncbi:MAG TPA: NAD-dependent epimerase/dehydratase family protein [Ilumatobacteraceae bacterium]|nr:NAD-dependent epimerase/dehydratase family protein [Ilumatobacteraceae bacterium]